jgi:toxin-antitoxin system PIN domain toxin
MPLSIDTNIFVYALNRDSDVHHIARRYLESVSKRTDVIVAEQALVELYLLIRNSSVFSHPYPAADAAAVCRGLRSNPSWRIVECRPVMDSVWRKAEQPGFARRKIIDARLALTLRAAGVTELATRNTADFVGFGFNHVFDPLDTEGKG